jgi:hypothetical protein
MGSERKEEFKITEDEVKKIGEALKDEQFRVLEISYKIDNFSSVTR